MHLFNICFLILVFSISSFANYVGEKNPEIVVDHKVVLHTNVGDIVLGLDSKIAPVHVQQILKLVAMGVYDGTPLGRVEKGFVLQFDAIGTRKTPLDPAQKAMVAKLPLEPNPVLHERGILSMARADGDIDSAETSFSILLGRAQHLDQKYTVFGKVIFGMDLVQGLENLPIDAYKRPYFDIFIDSAEVLPFEATKVESFAPARLPNIPNESSRFLFLIVAAVTFFSSILYPIYQTIRA